MTSVLTLNILVLFLAEVGTSTKQRNTLKDFKNAPPA